MSGHSKWHSIKHKKAAVDAKRGKIFTRLIKEITIAARDGGGDPDGNARLRTAITAAKAANMPADNIKRAIQKGTGELPGVQYEEAAYEGYGPGGVAVLVEIVTDNKNRTTPEIRNLFGKHGGNLGENGCVAWLFESKGLIHVEQKNTDEEAVLEIALEAGASDVVTSEETFDVFTSPESFETIRQALEDRGLPIAHAELGRFPSNYVRLEGKKAEQMLRLYDALEEHDDVQNVWANFDIQDA